MATNGDSKFGSCCASLREVLSGTGDEGDFDPLIVVGDDGVLYMTVGMVDPDEDEPGLLDHPVFFCPFCGTKLQTEAEVDLKSGAAGVAN